jgi:hypothetical protein
MAIRQILVYIYIEHSSHSESIFNCLYLLNYVTNIIACDDNYSCGKLCSPQWQYYEVVLKRMAYTTYLYFFNIKILIDC